MIITKPPSALSVMWSCQTVGGVTEVDVKNDERWDQTKVLHAVGSMIQPKHQRLAGMLSVKSTGCKPRMWLVEPMLLSQWA